ncbi:retrovirus-related pol polyprotein from transposon TNT 1-94, partial [Tanacetum coccineum]
YLALPTKKHLEALKWVFWYLRGTINWGLWYPKDIAMALTAYADADHAGYQDTRRNTSGSAQFLGDKLVNCLQTTALSSIRFSCIVTITVPLLSAAIMSSTPGPSKTDGYDRPRHYVLQILWGIIHRSNIDYAERIWEEFDENVLNTLRFIRKDGREIFGMSILDALLTDEIKGAPYFSGYLEHVAEYQCYLDEEHDKAEEEEVATESPKATKVTKPKAAKVTKPAEKKQKLVKETPDEPSLAKRSKGGLVGKRRKPKSPLKLVDEPSNEGVPIEDPAHTDEEADLQRVLELSLKEQAERTYGRPVVLREPDSRKYQPLPEVQGKGKEKVIDEQATHDLLTLQTPTKKSPADSPSLDAEIPLTDSETESDEEVPVINVGDQDEGQAGPNPGEPDEGQAGPNPCEQDDGQAETNPGDAAESQLQPSHVVHAGPKLEHMDLETTDALTQQKPEQMDEEFTKTAYPNVQENLKLLTEDQEEEPGKTNAEAEVHSMVSVPIHQDTSSVPPMTTPVIDLTTMQSDSPLPSSTATTSIIITTTTIPPPPPPQSTTYPILVHRIGKLEQYIANLVQNNLALEERLDKHGSRIYKLENLNIPHQVSKAVDEIVADAVDWAMQAPLRVRFRDLPTVDMKEILQQRMLKDNSYNAYEVHNDLYEALQKSLELDYSNQCLAEQEEARKKEKKEMGINALSTSGASGTSQLPPPPPPPSTGTSGSAQQQGSEAPSSSKTAVSAQQSLAWTTSDSIYELAGVSGAQELSPIESLIHDDPIPDEHVHLSNDEDSENDHLPKSDSRQTWWKPLPKEERPTTPEPAWTILSSNKSDVENNWVSTLAITYEPPVENSCLAKIGDMTTFMNWYCQKVNKTVLMQEDFEGQAYEVLKAFYLDVINLQIDVNQLLPLGRPLGYVTIQPQFFFIKGLEYLRYGSKGSNHAISISKMKAASYPDFGLELLVPEQMWIDDVYTYDITDFQEYTITKKDFKNLYPSDFEDLNLLLLQGHLDHLPGSYKRMLSTAVKQWTRNLDASSYEFKHDYTIIESPRAVVFLVDNNDRKIMRFNKIYKFSDRTLTCILEALDYRVKEFKVKRLNLEDTTSVIDHYLGGTMLGKSFVEETGLVYNKEEGTVIFEKGHEKVIFKMPYKIERFKHIDFEEMKTDLPPFVIEDNDDDHEKTYYSDSLNLEPVYRRDESITRALMPNQDEK